MARVRHTNNVEPDIEFTGIGSPSFADLVSSSATRLEIKAPAGEVLAGYSIVFEGLNFTYSGETITGGTVTRFEIYDDEDNLVFFVDQFPNAQRPNLVALTDAWAQNGPNAMFFQLMQHDDEITGSNENDRLGGFDGDDTVEGRGGNDYFYGNRGDDSINGGDGFDYISYREGTSGNNHGATRGIKANYNTGVVIDPWGDRDELTNVEWIQGSSLNDTIIAKSTDFFQALIGFDGNDNFRSKVNADSWLIYSGDADWGGDKGVIVDFGSIQDVAGKVVKGTVRGAFGDTDKTFDVRRVEGTHKNDKFIGSRLDDHFNGVGGKDSYNGGGGNDMVYLDSFAGADQQTNIVVNLGKTKNQIIKDGLGNTETARSIEGIRASERNDKLVGNNKSNLFIGDEGKDELTGKGGNDFFYYGASNSDFFNEGGDTITDFKRGQDMLVFNRDGVEGLGGQVLIRDGNSAAHKTKGSFYFKNNSLFYDVDGRNGDEDAIKVATLNGVNTLSSNDILIVNASSDNDFWV